MTDNDHSRFRDVPDFILSMTREIWEERGIARLGDYYSGDIVVRAPEGVVTGNANVVAATMATLAEFPDRQLLGEDVIWSGNLEDGLFSSHRILSTATHSGSGKYGKASGTQLVYRTIADCHATGHCVDDEWIIRDQGAIVRQLGIEPRAFARDLVCAEGGPEHCPAPLSPACDIKGPYHGHGNDNEWGMRLEDMLSRIMAGQMSVVASGYDRAVEAAHPGGRTGHGHAPVDRFWMGLRAAFPSARFSVAHRIGRDDAAMAPRAALRWSLTGAHDGWGSFGRPTGAQVHVMGITHAEFGAHGAALPALRREWTLLDETAIWKQILLHTGEL